MRRGRRLGRIALAGAALVMVAGLLGPRHRFEERWTERDVEPDVDAYLEAREAKVPTIRPGEAKSVAWVDPEARATTRLSLVYLHGFSADRHEVEPLVTELARDLGANAYFARLRGHGRDGAAMAEATVQDWLADVAEAVAIGGLIGERVVLVGTSTGATLALWAAAQEQAEDRLGALVLISPNFRPAQRTARLLLWPWGGLLARAVLGRERCFEAESREQERHWTTCYPTRALLPMMALVEHVRTMDLGRVTVPTLVVYSPDDRVVDTGETERVIAALGTDRATVFLVETSGDPADHVIAGDIMSPATTDAVRERILEFLDPLNAPRVGG